MSERLRAAAGAGNLRIKSNGKFEYRVTFKDEHGETRRKGFTADTEFECTEKGRKFLEEIEKKKLGINVECTIPDLIRERYEVNYKLNYVGEQGYARGLETLKMIENSNLGKLRIRDVTKVDIILYLSTITHYANATIQKSYQQLRMAYEIAVDKDIVSKNLMRSRDIKCPKSEREDKKIMAYTREEQKILEDAVKNHKVPYGRNDYKSQIMIELYTGMRMGEINALRPDDIDFEKKVVNVSRTVSRGENFRIFIKDGTKTYAGKREIPLCDRAIAELRNAIDKMEKNPDGLIFYDFCKDGIIDTSQVNLFLRRICEKCKLPFNGQHSLRHTFATRCIESGVTPVVLKEWLGHTDIHMTIDKYTDVFDSLNNAAVKQLDTYMSN